VDLTGDDVQDILQLLDGLPFGEMHLRTASFSLWLRRTPDGEWTQELEVLGEPALIRAASPGQMAGTGEVGAAAGVSEAGRPVPDGHRAVRAPLPGTFYRAPTPGAPPFVEPGSPVEPDTVVGIVETMKLMNSVSAGVRGTVAEILVANAEFAERDTVLMLIREDLCIGEERG
jgi:acetyl-CoA carboxylase biotin carboxyl carrier protein